MNESAAFVVRRADTGFVVSEHESVPSLSHRISEGTHGCVLVVDKGGALRGVVTYKEIVHALSTRGEAIFQMQARDIMRTNWKTCTPQQSDVELMGAMIAEGMQQMPVIEGPRIVGIITLTDAVKMRLAAIEQLAKQAEHKTPLEGMFTRHLKSHISTPSAGADPSTFLHRLLTIFNDLALEPCKVDTLAASILFYISSVNASGRTAGLREVLSFSSSYGSNPTIVKRLRWLLREGFLEKSKSNSDGRPKYSLTDESQKLVKDLHARCVKIFNDHVSPPWRR